MYWFQDIESARALARRHSKSLHLPCVTWRISANLGRYPRAAAHGGGWLWEIDRGTQTAQVIVEISPAAWSADPRQLPQATRRALESDGRTEIIKILETDTPPRVIRCDSEGCAPHCG
jgi:hypothetical protein